MIVKGIIQNIDYNTNTCLVRMPIFESVGNINKSTAEATILIQPGQYNGYKVGDVVFVGFENNTISNPIVLGLLYLGANEENKRGNRGVINTEDVLIKENKLSTIISSIDTLKKEVRVLKDLLLNNLNNNTSSGPTEQEINLQAQLNNIDEELENILGESEIED